MNTMCIWTLKGQVISAQWTNTVTGTAWSIMETQRRKAINLEADKERGEGFLAPPSGALRLRKGNAVRVKVSQQNGTFVIIDKPILTYNHPESIVYVRVYTWCSLCKFLTNV